jgi:hypothetical protein
MDQITLAVYDDGLLITVNGQSYKKVMSPLQMLWLSQELSLKVSTYKEDCLSFHEDELWQEEDIIQETPSNELCNVTYVERTTTPTTHRGLLMVVGQPSATVEALQTASIEDGEPLKKERILLSDIMEQMKQHLGINQVDLRNKRRKSNMVQARSMFVKLATEFTEASYPTIGQYINRDHTTVMKGEKSKLTLEYGRVYERIRDQFISTTT